MDAPREDAPPVVVPIEHELDLHAFAPRDVPSVVDEYLRAAREKGLREVRLVHGRGKGVQRAVVHRLLSGHPLVDGFHDDPRAHLGATLVRLRGA
ncbi:MAG: Smr/MutS family protein [Vicinamibacterales bacterium]|jgi:DNA-nicking Smr family endonuclease|nr:Smr/MutS family protein [Vicinamibacterales bacterium]